MITVRSTRSAADIRTSGPSWRVVMLREGGRFAADEGACRGTPRRHARRRAQPARNVHPDRMSIGKRHRHRIVDTLANTGQGTVGGSADLAVRPAGVAFRSFANIHRYLSMSLMENSPRP